MGHPVDCQLPEIKYELLNLAGCDHSEPHLHAGPNYDVHQRQQQLAQDLLYEDGGRVAVVQPAPALHYCPAAYLHGHSEE